MSDRDTVRTCLNCVYCHLHGPERIPVCDEVGRRSFICNEQIEATRCAAYEQAEIKKE